MFVLRSFRFRKVVLEPEQRKMVSLVQQINTVRNQKLAKRKETKQRKKEEKERRSQHLQQKFGEVEKAKKKREYAREGAVANKKRRV
jgi:ribosome biogenesis protein BMS1